MHFETAGSRFGDKFQGVVSMRMDEKGFKLNINRPVVQLLFYLGFCYQQQDQFDKTIGCWAHIRTGSAGKKGGNAFAWASLGLAISNGDPESVRGLLYVLLNRAKAHTAAGRNDDALADFQRVYVYAKMAESNSELWDSVFRQVVAWVTDELGIPEPKGQ
ncbi:hypothetical protein [uncultured Thiodictyon sp.]|jgi:hypothetical protein|uniref:hypothetical protein n=1 Tax=uncultured Thiodictyon sp. TaxID=1846217 RepID=UPI0025D3787C|nr:hypothetical protein [uncultured Thiodictyon sp.]